jgi:hypothetical protein
MARIIVGSYMVRYPLGGMMSWVLQYLIGFARLGHDVYFVEKSGYPLSCYHPPTDSMGDDCTYGTSMVDACLSNYDLRGRWCYVDAAGVYHGMSRAEIESVFRTADVFVDMGTHGAWLPEASTSGTRVLVDGEPGLSQLKMQNALDSGSTLPEYDWYFSNGRNLANGTSLAPAAGRAWRAIFHPVVTDQVEVMPVADNAPFTTVMNWQSYGRVERAGQEYGHKDVEFDKFVSLPSRVAQTLELAVSGRQVPRAALRAHGWRLRDGHEVTASVEAFNNYIHRSRGEFSVCKNGFVALRTGWFSDRSAVYLASGRPVVMQDTGFSAHLPVGRGLFAVDTVDDAAAAFEVIAGDYAQQARAARELAEEYLDARQVLGAFLREIGL